MLFLVMSLLYWSPTDGVCRGTVVSILGADQVLPAGDGFNLSCEFTCLRPNHVAQMWKNDAHQVQKLLLNVTSNLPSLTVVLSVGSAAKADSGNYSCMTQPPDTISPEVTVEVTAPGNLTTSTPTTGSSPQCDSTLQSNHAGLQGQMWFWILLGKTAILLLSLATLAVKSRK